ncbi:MAG TPA: glutamine-hydrolyzing GMP synthase [Candidatus Omnitrophota bacterium]|nr:glutamine-hydrolyzing GMP synthase [Candidatus Omnitrophota bacterium]HQB94851.1 glutamine-hydrolyzing GMP synthase [Candidatus Omnitrophota bacterium]
MDQTIVVLDFGSQYTQLIARRVREAKVFSKVYPFYAPFEEVMKDNPKGIIFSGSPANVYAKNAPIPDNRFFYSGIPILGICYGMQLLSHKLGGRVHKSRKREYGFSKLHISKRASDLFEGLPKTVTCWMSHGDKLDRIPQGFERLAYTENAPFAAMGDAKKKIYAIQFHAEVAHTELGAKILENFLVRVCGCKKSWTPRSFINESVKKIRRQVGKDRVVLGLSGGVDSSVVAGLIHKAIGKQLTCIFVNNGLLRRNEVERVNKTFRGHFKMNLKVIDAEKIFLARLKGVTEPEQKRKIIGKTFIDVFQKEANRLGKVPYLAQGTLYPDVIESVSYFGGPTSTIKSHHNVGGLPKNMKFKLIEPLKELFKDEVRAVGYALGIDKDIVGRQPFPGPGLAVRILGEVRKDRCDLLRAADWIVVDEIKKSGYYDKVWQSFAVLLPVQSVGVMGDERTYENAVAIRAVTSLDGMTADWAKLPYDLLGRISNRIINEVRGINRVTYDISSKPPATIEWE